MRNNDLCWFSLVISGNPKRLKLGYATVHAEYLYCLNILEYSTSVP
jgi:hypothetical protein